MSSDFPRTSSLSFFFLFFFNIELAYIIERSLVEIDFTRDIFSEDNAIPKSANQIYHLRM